eukprot:ctg_1223.g395
MQTDSVPVLQTSAHHLHLRRIRRNRWTVECEKMRGRGEKSHKLALTTALAAVSPEPRFSQLAKRLRLLSVQFSSHSGALDEFRGRRGGHAGHSGGAHPVRRRQDQFAVHQRPARTAHTPALSGRVGDARYCQKKWPGRILERSARCPARYDWAHRTPMHPAVLCCAWRRRPRWPMRWWRWCACRPKWSSSNCKPASIVTPGRQCEHWPSGRCTVAAFTRGSGRKCGAMCLCGDTIRGVRAAESTGGEPSRASAAHCASGHRRLGTAPFIFPRGLDEWCGRRHCGTLHHADGRGPHPADDSAAGRVPRRVACHAAHRPRGRRGDAVRRHHPAHPLQDTLGEHLPHQFRGHPHHAASTPSAMQRTYEAPAEDRRGTPSPPRTLYDSFCDRTAAAGSTKGGGLKLADQVACRLARLSTANISLVSSNLAASMNGRAGTSRRRCAVACRPPPPAGVPEWLGPHRREERTFLGEGGRRCFVLRSRARLSFRCVCPFVLFTYRKRYLNVTLGDEPFLSPTFGAGDARQPSPEPRTPPLTIQRAALRLQQTPSPLSRCTSPARLTRYCLSRLRLCESGAPPLHSETQPSRQAEHRSTPPDRSLDTAVGGDGRGGSGGGAGGPNGGGGSGGANGDDGSRGVDPELLGVMLAYQRALSSLPAELQEAVRHGWLTRTQLAGYLSQDRSWMSWLLRWPMLRNRVLCDPEFMFKLWVQEWVGNGTQLVGELLVRGREIVDELEYVLADLVVGTVVEASFVVLLAPAMPFLRRPPSAAPATRGTGAVLEAYRRWSLSLPANAFEASIPPARVYSLTSRFITVVNASAQYFAIGVVCGLVGTALTYAGAAQLHRLGRVHGALQQSALSVGGGAGAPVAVGAAAAPDGQPGGDYCAAFGEQFLRRDTLCTVLPLDRPADRGRGDDGDNRRGGVDGGRRACGAGDIVSRLGGAAGRGDARDVHGAVL